MALGSEKEYTLSVLKTLAKPFATVAGSVLGAISGAADRRQQQRQHREAMGFAREQFDYGKYRDQNQYQMKVQDMVAAGLHPTLAAGGGGLSGQVAGTAPQPTKRESIMAQAMQGAQLGLIQSQIQLQEAQAGNYQADTDLKRQEHAADLPNKTAQQMLRDLEEGKYSIDFLRNQVQKQVAEINQLRQSTTNLEDLNRRENELFEITIAVAAHDLRILQNSALHSSSLHNYLGTALSSLTNTAAETGVTSLLDSGISAIGKLLSEYGKYLNRGTRQILQTLLDLNRRANERGKHNWR